MPGNVIFRVFIPEKDALARRRCLRHAQEHFPDGEEPGRLISTREQPELTGKILQDAGKAPRWKSGRSRPTNKQTRRTMS